MNRAVVVAVLATIALASPASGAPTPIRHDRSASAVALAGPDVLVMSERSQGGVRVVSVPRTGGKARTLLSVAGAGLSSDSNRIAASSQRVGVIVEIDSTRRRPTEHRVYSGPPWGPLTLVRRTEDPDGEAWTPFTVSVDGDRLLLVEGIPVSTGGNEEQEGEAQLRAQILDASGWTPVPWTTGTRVPIAIAGPYAAVAAGEPQRMELADLATGTPLATVTGEWPERLAVDLTADGRLAVGVQRGIELASAGQPQRRVPGLASPQFAGGSLAAFDEDAGRLTLLGADGARQTLGPRSLIHTDVDADESGVAWLFNGCVRYAALGTSAAEPPAGPSPCPTSELALYGIGPSSRLRGNRADARVRCVSSTTGRCRGRLVARLDYDTPVVGRGRFDVPVGDKGIRVPVRFDRRTVAKFRRDGHGSVIIDAKLRDGTVGSGADYSSELGIEVGDR